MAIREAPLDASDSTLKDWLDQQFQATGASQAYVATAAGIQPGYLSMLRGGTKSAPKPRVVEGIARVFARLRKEPPDRVIDEAFAAARLTRIDTEPTREAGLVELQGQLVAVRPLKYLLERETDAKEIWIVRSNTYFLSGFPGETRESMVSLLNDGTRDFYFVFRRTPEPVADAETDLRALRPSDNPPRDSFAHFKRALLVRDQAEKRSPAEGLFAHAHGYQVESPLQMLALGLGMTYAATVVLIYKDEAKDRLRRDYDILSEMYIATYENLDNRSETEYLAWIEVPPRRARTLWLTWEPIFDEIRNNVKTAGFLSTPQDVLSFQPGQLVSL